MARALSQLGVCVSVDFGGSGTGYTWVQDVDIYTPTLTNGTQSCPSGTFTPVSASPAPPAQ